MVDMLQFDFDRALSDLHIAQCFSVFIGLDGVHATEGLGKCHILQRDRLNGINWNWAPEVYK